MKSSKKPMTMKEYERSSMDKAADKKALGKINAKRGGGMKKK